MRKVQLQRQNSFGVLESRRVESNTVTPLILASNLEGRQASRDRAREEINR